MSVLVKAKLTIRSSGRPPSFEPVESSILECLFVSKGIIIYLGRLRESHRQSFLAFWACFGANEFSLNPEGS